MRNLLWAAAIAFCVTAAYGQEPAPAPDEEAATVEEAIEEIAAEVEPHAEEPEAEQPEEQPTPEPEAEEDPYPPVDPLGALFAFLSAGGIMGIAQLLRYFKIPQRIPSFVRPLIGPAIALVGGFLATLFGAPLDLSAIELALLGTGAGTLFSMGSAAGVFSSKKGSAPFLSSTGSGS